jgi:hypothetical protein
LAILAISIIPVVVTLVVLVKATGEFSVVENALQKF